MPENIFFLITYIVFGFSFLPALLILLRPNKRSYFESNIKIISIVELVTNLSNLSLYHLGLGHLKQQYFIYSILQVFCWIFLLRINRLSKPVTWILISLSLTIFFISFYFDLSILSPIYSRMVQLLLGIYLLKIEMKKNLNVHKKSGFLVAIALIIYSVSSINILIFDSFISIMNVSNFNYIWSTHQFAALFYYVLLSISIWKSQKI
jgi:hypothetical protein